MPLFGGERVGYKAKYLGGHGAFPKALDCRIVVLHDHVEIPELPLTIYYEQMTNVQSVTQEKLTAMRLLLLGILAFALKKKKLYMVLSYKDQMGVDQNMVFDVEKIGEIQPAIYRNMVARAKKE